MESWSVFKNNVYSAKLLPLEYKMESLHSFYKSIPKENDYNNIKNKHKHIHFLCCRKISSSIYQRNWTNFYLFALLNFSETKLTVSTVSKQNTHFPKHQYNTGPFDFFVLRRTRNHSYQVKKENNCHYHWYWLKN